jgi:hypothetical protein
VAKSIYTDKEVFIRELLSNCSDALEKRRFLIQSGKESVDSGADELFISITTNSKERTITLFDSGIGNFIKTTKADDVFGCLKYSFNLEYFMTSELFKTIVDREKKDLCLSIKAMEQKYAEISELNK